MLPAPVSCFFVFSHRSRFVFHVSCLSFSVFTTDPRIASPCVLRIWVSAVTIARHLLTPWNLANSINLILNLLSRDKRWHFQRRGLLSCELTSRVLGRFTLHVHEGFIFFYVHIVPSQSCTWSRVRAYPSSFYLRAASCVFVPNASDWISDALLNSQPARILKLHVGLRARRYRSGLLFSPFPAFNQLISALLTQLVSTAREPHVALFPLKMLQSKANKNLRGLLIVFVWRGKEDSSWCYDTTSTGLNQLPERE